jgi:phosphohistidine phosphatase
MKSLFIMRHAKSDWPAGTDDADRPLAPRGRRTTPLVARQMRADGLVPDLILCSTARRTRDTHALLTAPLGDMPVRFLPELYLASPALLLRQVRQSEESAGSILLIGHNPGLHSLAMSLAGDGDGAALASLREKFPTGAVAILRFPGQHWRDIAPGAGRLEAFIRPRDLDG